MENPGAFFKDHSCLHAVIDAAVQGRAGRIVAGSSKSTCLRLDIGCYPIFGGDPDHEEARALLKGVDPNQEMVYAGSRWKKRIQSIYVDAADASMMTFLPGPHFLEIARHHLGELALGYEIQPLKQGCPLNDSLTPNGFQVYETKKGFFENGFGFQVTHEGIMIALTTTYCLSRDKAEIAIATDPHYRKQGLATSLASAMILECARRGLVPNWSASNPVSQRIARRIGLVDHEVCTVLKRPASNPTEEKP